MSPIHHRWSSVLALGACVLALQGPALAQDWSRETFLSDYSKLQPVKGKETTDFAYVIPDVEKIGARYDSVMLDQPEIFIAADSPYKGAKPADAAAIAQLIRQTATAALQQRGYAIVDAPKQNVLYARIAVTELQIHKKDRGILAYTPVGFVVDAGVKALQGFMDKYDILNMSIQVELRDSATQQVLAEAVLRSGKQAGAKHPVSFDTMVTTVDDLAARLACRLDNGHVAPEQRIDCFDPAARKARPLIVGR